MKIKRLTKEVKDKGDEVLMLKDTIKSIDEIISRMKKILDTK